MHYKNDIYSACRMLEIQIVDLNSSCVTRYPVHFVTALSAWAARAELVLCMHSITKASDIIVLACIGRGKYKSLILTILSMLLAIQFI